MLTLKEIDIAACNPIKFKGSTDEGNLSDGNNYGICVEYDLGVEAASD
jgi:hypothetical protein